MTTIIFNQLTSLFIIMIAGYYLTKIGVIDGRVIKGLTGLLTKLMLPALVISSLQMQYSADDAATMGLAAICMAVTIIGGAILMWVAHTGFKFISGKALNKSELGAWMCACAFPNALYIGKPLMEALYGSSILFILSAMTIVFNVLCFSAGVYLITMGRDGSGGVKAFFKSLVNPTIIAGVLGVIMYAFSISLPPPILNALNMLSNTLTPISMLIIGYSLVGISIKETLLDRKLYAICALRLIICPVALHLCMRLFVNDEALLNIMAVAISLPVASMVGVLSEQYDNPHKALSSKAIVVSTVLSLVTVPVMFMLLSKI